MTATAGTLWGVYNGVTLGLAWNTSNSGNPNAKQGLDLLQIVGEGGNVILNLTSAGVVHAPGVSPTNGTMIGVFSGTNVLGTSASLVCQGTFPENYANQKLDIIQIFSEVPQNGYAGGQTLIGRLAYNGVYSTT